MSSEQRQLAAGSVTFDPPDGAQIPEGVVRNCTITTTDPVEQNAKIILKQATPDPRFRINGLAQAEVTLSKGRGAFTVSRTYPASVEIRPDTTHEIVAQYEGANIGNVTYTMIVRDALTIVPPTQPEFAVFAGDNLSMQLHGIDGEDQPVGGLKIRMQCYQSNVQFFDANGDEITGTMYDPGGQRALYGDYVTDNTNGLDLGIAGGELGAKNTGIFDIAYDVIGFNNPKNFTLVVADDQIMGGSLSAPILSAASPSLNLGGAATTFVRLLKAPIGVRPDAKVVFIVNGLPVSPYSLTVQEAVEMGYELPKLWFTKESIEGVDPKNKAQIYYMIQSESSDITETRSGVKKFDTFGTVVNAPDPNLGPRKLPMPTLGNVNTVNSSVIQGGVLPVEIDFTDGGVSAGSDGFITLYANGYLSNTSTILDHAETITQSFKTKAGKNVIDVDAGKLWGFTDSATFKPSNLKMDYYVTPGAPPAEAAQGDVSKDDEFWKQRDASKQYSKFDPNGWTLATPLPPTP
ncbi:hypothetical protein [Trinickia dinghuensis]|uniref:Uncharacterized protein n=1 Tax=Trinickia dinghuensis TaxID=2291023 RepID=A0A3D8JWE4_9BURK|nr:hypothetical protein [Trinickia dinghuensis]RDU96936.1 hypothetical protein DWV00_19950 [Trinickia dinghuensis]